ncbi:hypothetical protein [Mucilaginibacter terrae]|uniref:Uncharacterized protein n=1 Tax=Mucilaginibacter terrae TaxID=1955052 RepID=A0ABU3GZB9_9SPHI|nr:hypothetical protein [Mucilaginibacter terrae]MDT3405114.1 hypothetical protein [Mucilaginibacter terrae]
MIQQTIKTLTGNLLISIPDNLHEISLKQLMAMQAAEKLSDLDAMSILSGIPLTELQQIKDYNDLQLFNEQILQLAAQIKDLYNSSAIPNEVTFAINGKATKVKVVKNLSVEPAGAFMAARDVIAEEISKHIALHGEEDWQQTFNPSLQACSQVLAYYFYSRATGQPYDEELAAAFASQVEELPVTQVLPIAKYFFLNYPHLSKPKTGFWHRLCRLWSSGRASKILSTSGTSTPLTHWPGEI